MQCSHLFTPHRQKYWVTYTLQLQELLGLEKPCHEAPRSVSALMLTHWSAVIGNLSVLSDLALALARHFVTALLWFLQASTVQ